MKYVVMVIVLTLIVVVGIGMYVTDFTAYLGNNPTTCNNCHVMDAVYESWAHAGHARWASCNDCHTPHALIPKYIVKAQSGYHHVTAFISNSIPDAIRAKPSSKDVVQENCIRCHEETVSAMIDNIVPLERYCFDCHRTVAHGERGISLLPYRHEEKSK